MSALSRSAATAVSTLPPADRGPRRSVACRNSVSAAPLWGSCRLHVLLHAAVAAMMASAAFSVVHAQAEGWSTAQLSQARASPSATSVGTMAIFAGGYSSKLLGLCLLCEGLCYGNYGVLCFGLAWWSDCILMRTTAGGSVLSNVVDLYDRGTGLWSTARLSQGRVYLSATSVGTVAIFAGGSLGGKLLRIVFVCCVR
jgi:hypothetical protein